MSRLSLVVVPFVAILLIGCDDNGNAGKETPAIEPDPALLFFHHDPKARLMGLQLHALQQLCEDGNSPDTIKDN